MWSLPMRPQPMKPILTVLMMIILLAIVFGGDPGRLWEGPGAAATVYHGRGQVFNSKILTCFRPYFPGISPTPFKMNLGR